MTAAPLVYLDTSVFVSALLGRDEPDYDVSASTLEAGERGELRIVVSALAVSEVVGAPVLRAPQGVPKSVALERTAKAMAFFGQSSFTHVDLSRREGLRAAEISRDFDMKGADALHLAAAELAGCERFFSLDRDQLKVADALSGLIISKPPGSGQPALNFPD
ncbi:MAG TPA: PIN domain-containing protein [Nocardioides sp.]